MRELPGNAYILVDCTAMYVLDQTFYLNDVSMSIYQDSIPSFSTESY